ncbi:MAG: hypothetical protein KME26_30925 [Oscillatoria princeps RMCB-10]|jgi:hypothetical protein|nr:hypothetical protein [Oscillatoria princeps RMCB-10]
MSLLCSAKTFGVALKSAGKRCCCQWSGPFADPQPAQGETAQDCPVAPIRFFFNDRRDFFRTQNPLVERRAKL